MLQNKKNKVQILITSIIFSLCLASCSKSPQKLDQKKLISETKGELEQKNNRYESKEILWINSWEESLFQHAKNEKLLVLLNLEATWCHWCHVMETKTYSSPEVIKYINQHYLPVKVDQDSNPYLSSRYKQYGWPATIIFDSNGKELAKKSGFINPEKMLKLLTKFKDNPIPEKDFEKKINYSKSTQLSSFVRRRLEENFFNTADFKDGGLKIFQKYIDRDSLEYALRRLEIEQDSKIKKKLRKYVSKTLDNALSLLDKEWGGFYQYSTKGSWDNPHYEKVADIQAEYIRIYSLGYKYLGDKEYKDTAIKTVQYLEDFLTSRSGTFYASQDADLFAGEKANDYFSLSSSKRKSLGIPKIDKHVYSDKNGKMIEALSTLYAATSNIKYLEQAMHAADSIIEKRMLANGAFKHSKDQASYLEDNLYMARALLKLYEASTQNEWLNKAELTAQYIIDSFKDQSPGYISVDLKSTKFSALSKPSPRVQDNIKLARFFNSLFHYTGKNIYKDEAQNIMRYLGSQDIALNSITEPGILLLDMELANDPVHITVVGAKRDSKAKKLFLRALQYPSSYLRVEWYDPKGTKLKHHDVEYPKLNKAAAFTCNNKTCSLPIFKAKDLF